MWLGYALSILGGSLRVFFPDIAHVLPVLLQIAMWTAPIVYTPEVVPAALRSGPWINSSAGFAGGALVMLLLSAFLGVN